MMETPSIGGRAICPDPNLGFTRSVAPTFNFLEKEELLEEKNRFAKVRQTLRNLEWFHGLIGIFT